MPKRLPRLLRVPKKDQGALKERKTKFKRLLLRIQMILRIKF
jgi:hypothetical protein